MLSNCVIVPRKQEVDQPNCGECGAACETRMVPLGDLRIQDTVIGTVIDAFNYAIIPREEFDRLQECEATLKRLLTQEDKET